MLETFQFMFKKAALRSKKSYLTPNNIITPYKITC